MRTKDCFGGFGSEAAADLVAFSTALYEDSPEPCENSSDTFPLVCFVRISVLLAVSKLSEEKTYQKKCHELKKAGEVIFSFVEFQIPIKIRDGVKMTYSLFILWINNKRRQPRTMKILLALAVFTLVCVRADNKSNFYENDLFEPLAKLASGKTVFIK